MNQTETIPYRETREGKIYQSKLENKFELPPESLNTLSKFFLYHCEKYNQLIAMRKKRYGIWNEYTWQDTYEHVVNFCLGLISLGFQADETVVLIGENDPEFYWAQIATHAVRSRSCGVFSDANPSDLVYVVNETRATFLVAHDQEQVDKALEIKEQIPNIRKVIYWDDKGMWNYSDEWLASFEDIEALGKEYRKTHPHLFEELVAKTEYEDCIILSMTSGTTSLPKFAMITNKQLIYGNFMNSAYVPSSQEDNWLSFSPMAWLTEQAFGFAAFLLHGMQVNFPESGETVTIDIREIAPAGLLFPSRVWENLASSIRFRIADSSFINRWLYARFMPVAYEIIDREDTGKRVGSRLKFLRFIGEYAIFEPLRDKLGLTRTKNVLTAGAMLSPDVIRFFRAIGVELRQLYASTETFGTIHVPGDVKLESVGVIVPGVEIKIAEDQEILIRTEAKFAGYFEDPEKTGESIDVEGWYHTGDAGYITEDHHLIYLERVKDMIDLSTGHSFSPQYIEGRLKFSPYIRDIMTIGGFDMAYVTAIIIIDFENVARWAEKQNLIFTTMVDLSQKQEVYDLIRHDIQQVNQSLPAESRLKKFVILHKEFDADEGELTRTRKLRRGVLHTKYAEILEALYGGQEKVNIRAEVKYRDGRSGIVETALNVCDIESIN